MTAFAGVVSVLSACSEAVTGVPAADPDARVPSSAPSEPTELVVATFGEYGFDELLTRYQDEHPAMTIEHQKSPDGSVHHQKLQTSMAGGAAPDVVLIADGYLPEFLDKPDLFADLAEVGPEDVTPRQWLDWRYQAGVAADGTWVGYGVDCAPMAMAYRTDLFAEADLPTKPDRVASLFESWDSYFAAGDRYFRATDRPWFDSAARVFHAMHGQLETGYFDQDNELVLASNSGIADNWDQVTGAINRGQSASLPAFGSEWMGGLREEAFATVVAPPWMLGLIEEQGGDDNAGDWAVAEVFPGGSGNEGGSYLAVPRDSAHQEQAAELAAWLTAPEQQVAVFESTGTLFPSRVDAVSTVESMDTANDYFGGVEVGRVYAALAGRVRAHHKAPHDTAVQQEAITPALEAVEGGVKPGKAWRTAVDDAERIAGG